MLTAHDTAPAGADALVVLVRGAKVVCVLALVSGLAVCALPAASAHGPLHGGFGHSQGHDRKQGRGSKPGTGTTPSPVARQNPLVTQSSAPAATAPAFSASLASDVLVQLNAIRVQHHLVPLTSSSALTTSATQHTSEMATDGYFAHSSQDGTPFWKRIQQWYPQGSFHSWEVGENLVWAAPDLDAAGAIQLWMASPEHRANILDPSWREIGIAALHVNAAPGAYQGLAVTIIDTDFGVRS